ncbi:MAG: ribonuclease Z [Candidatus Micrarchaeota archaeon]|nr:ribonuclease Z [Candidatus Micrarchaeota archaeon]
MEIRVLGTGGGFDISNSSILIDNTLLIDIGPYVYPKIKDASISHILLTHAHGDHVMGLWQYAPFRDLHIYGEKPTLERVKSFLESLSDQELLSFHNITWHPLEERGSLHILNYRISYQKARHTGEIDTLIYRINNLVYSTDNVESPEHVPFLPTCRSPYPRHRK